jgi:hypothetical protein
MGNATFMVSKVVRLIMGFIKSKRIPKIDKKRKNAKSNPTFDLFFALKKYKKNDNNPAIASDRTIRRMVDVVIVSIQCSDFSIQFVIL